MVDKDEIPISYYKSQGHNNKNVLGIWMVENMDN